MMEYILLLLVLFITELAYFKLANHFNIIDKPNERSSHKKITLRGGGIIFIFSICAYFIIHPNPNYYFLIGFILIGGISFIDDIKSLSSKVRLGIHLTAILLLFYQLDLFHYNGWVLILALMVCVGIINMYNFMDGINGITGGYSTVIVVGLTYVNTYHTHFIDQHLLYYIIAGLLVFNFFNFRKKAICFAGDVGSISMAFIILLLLGNLILKTNDFSYLIFLVVYGIDSVCTIIHRLWRKEDITKPHRMHIYQILANELKIPHLVVSGIYMGLQSLLIVGYFICFEFRYIYFGMICIILIILYILLMKKYFHLHKKEINNIV